MDPSFARRAQEAPPAEEMSELDLLAADLSPLALARRKVAHETLEHLEPRFRELAGKSVAELKRELQAKQDRAPSIVPTLKDGGAQYQLNVARLERLIQLREEQEQQRQQYHQQPPADYQAGQLDPSKSWLNRAMANQEEAVAHSGGRRQVVPRNVALQGRSSRDFGGLAYEHDRVDLANNAPAASRGAPAQPSKRHQQLLQPSNQPGKARNQQQQRQEQQPQQQQQQSADGCEACGRRGAKLRPARATDTGLEVRVCYECFHTNTEGLQPIIRQKQSTLDDSLRPQQLQTEAGGSHRQGQPRKGALPLKRVPTPSFFSNMPSAQNAAIGAGPAGGAAAARGPPRRGKGQRRASSDDDYTPGAEAAQQQRLNWDEDEDSDFEHMSARARKRPRAGQRQRRSRGASQDAANAEPVCIDLLSDEDGEPRQQTSADGAAAAAAAAAGDRPSGRLVRATRAKAYRSTSDRFKGLKCLYPPGGGAGAVELTAQDLTRLDAEEFLNDSVIDFYIRWLQDHLDRTVTDRCYFFNTFFFKKLTEETGGALPADLEEWARQKGLKGAKLQALRNHQKVRNWTKDVDLFSKDFIFVPVHEALHWSLMVVCHPGVVMPKDKEQAGSGAKTPCILHLDSLAGSHRGNALSNKLRLYLEFEWHIKSLPSAPDGVPKRWAEAHPGQSRSWAPSEFPLKIPKVPVQDNHCDCGLYMCAYTEYFTHRLPPAINVGEVEALMKSYSATNRDLFEGTDDCIPGLLTDKWFERVNPSHLRWEIRRLILECMADQHKLRDPATGQWVEGDEMAEEVSRELLQLQSRTKYVRPRDWEHRALVNKQQRQAALQRREQEALERKEMRAKRQAGAAKSPSAPGTKPDRDTLACAAEARLKGASSQAQTSSGLFAALKDVAAEPDSGADSGAFQELPGLPPLQPLTQQAPATQSADEQRFEDLLDDGGDEGAKQVVSVPDSQDPAAYADFNIDLDNSPSDDERGKLARQEGTAAAAAGGQGSQRRSATPDLCSLPPEPSPGGRKVLGLGSGGLPSRGASKRPQHIRWPSDDEGDAVPQQQQQQKQQKQQHQDEQPAAKRPRHPQQQQQQQQQQTVDLSDSPLLDNVKSSSKERSTEEGSELEIVDDPADSPAKQLERQLAGARGQSPPVQIVFTRDRHEAELEWQLVVEVKAVLRSSSAVGHSGEPRIAELRFTYQDDSQYTVFLPFLAPSTGASVSGLYEWLHRYEAHLNSVCNNVDTEEVEAWEEQEGGALHGSRRASPPSSSDERRQQQQQQPQQQQRDGGQGNGRATATGRTRRGRSTSGANATSEAAAVRVAVAEPTPQQHQHLQQQACAAQGSESEVIDIDGSLPLTQEADVDANADLRLEEASPQQAPAIGVASKAARGAACSTAGAVHGSASGSGLVAEQMEHLHLQPAQPLPAAVAAGGSRPTAAQAAAAKLQERQRQQRRLEQAADVSPVRLQDCLMGDAGPSALEEEWEAAAPPTAHLQPPAGQGVDPAAATAATDGVGPTSNQQQQHAWNPHLLRSSGQDPAVHPPAEAAPAAVSDAGKRVLYPPAPAPAPRADPWHVRVMRGGQAAEAQPATRPGSAGGTELQLGRPQAHDERYALPGARLQRNSPRLTPPPLQSSAQPQAAAANVGFQAAALADDAEQAAAAQLKKRQQQQQQQQQQSRPGPLLEPAQVVGALQFAAAGATQNGALARRLASDLTAQQRQLRSRLQAAELRSLRRPQQVEAVVVDLASDDD